MDGEYRVGQFLVDGIDLENKKQYLNFMDVGPIRALNAFQKQSSMNQEGLHLNLSI